MTLAGLAITELFRQPATFLLIVSCSVFTVVVPMGIAHQLGQQIHLSVDSSLAFEFVFGIILAGYAACATLHNECRSGTILILFSKPVGRLAFFLAKFTAVATVLLFFVLCCSTASMLAERLAPRNFEFDELGLKLLLLVPGLALIPAAILNFRTRRSYVLYALPSFALAMLALVAVLGMIDREGHRVAFGSMIDWRILPACLLEGIALLILASIAISLATRLATPTTVAALAFILFAGLISDHLGNLFSSHPSIHLGIATLLPDIQAFWPADRLTGGGSIPPAAMAHAGAYAIAYSAGILGLGYTAFRNRQF